MIKDPKTFVAVLLSFIYATPVKLGFNSDIKECTPTEPSHQYFVYTVNDDKVGMIYFKMLQSLSEYHLLCISGRATWVWKVIQIRSPNDHSPVGCAKEVVLKDIWIEQDVKTECELQTSMWMDIDTFTTRILPGGRVPQLESSGPGFERLIRDTLVDEKWKKLFLMILFDGIGIPSKECPKSARPDATLFNKPHDQPVAPHSQAADHSRAYSTSILREETSCTSVMPATLRKFAPRRCYTVVFEELCQAMENLTSFSDMMDAMKDAVKGDIVPFSPSF